MCYYTDKRFLINYGWKHYWCDPDILKNCYLREVVKGPFAKPQFLNSVPYVTVCQQDGSAIRLSEGIPDPWLKYLVYNLRLFQNYESMHKEDLDIVSRLRKHYRLYIGQGIPSPGVVDCEIYSTSENPRKHASRFSHRKKFKNHLKKEHCNSCTRKYLFKCPDGFDTTSNSSLKNCHSKNDSIKKSKCIYRATKAHERRKHSKESLISSPKESSFAADDESENEPHCQRNLLPKGRFEDCSCPYIKNFYLKRKTPLNKNVSKVNDIVKSQENNSKLIQANIQPSVSSKSVQTDILKADCSTQCFWCNIVPCNSSWGAPCKQRNHPGGCEVGCPNVCPFTSFRFPGSCAQNATFFCPYSFSNHFIPCEPRKKKSSGLKKHSLKKKQLKESEDDLNSEFRFNPMQQNEATDGNFKWINIDQEVVKPNYDVLRNNNIYSSSKLMKNFDHMKYLTDDKLKYYLQRERFFQQPTGAHFDTGNTPFYCPSRVQLERFKSFSHSTPEQFKTLYEEKKISTGERNG